MMTVGIDTLISVVPYVSKHFGLQGLACLAASSQQLNSVCFAVAQQDASHLLLQALDAAQHAAAGNIRSAALQQRQQQHLEAAAWLLQAAPALAMSADVTERLVRLPSTSLKQAVKFVAAGVRVSYALVVAAANSMVAGEEVWVQAQQKLGIHTDIPAAAAAMCCGENWVSDCIQQGFELHTMHAGQGMLTLCSFCMNQFQSISAFCAAHKRWCM
jgi:hypothetical protein